MKLEETFSPAGDLRYRMLRKMLRIVTKHGLALVTISNWALGIVGLGGGFLIANIDKVDKHVSLCSRRWLFVLALLSAGVGCLIKVLSGLVTFDLNVEGKIFRYVIKTKQEQQNAIPDFDNVVLLPVRAEFMASRPQPFRILGKRALKKIFEKDILQASKMGSCLAQFVMLLLLVQLLFLALAGMLLCYAFLWRNIK
jgi:hypothetical protein